MSMYCLLISIISERPPLSKNFSINYIKNSQMIVFMLPGYGAFDYVSIIYRY